MKNIIKTLAAVAMIALAASCSKDAAEAPAVKGDATVTFSVEMPGIASRATNDGTTATELYYAVYEAGTVGKTDGQFLFQDKQAINLSTTVNLELVADQTYDIVFWAQAANTHTPNLANKTIAMNYDDAVAGADETRDAFIGFVDNLEIKGSANETVYLKRPFAQLNVALSEGQLAAAEKAGFELKTVTVKTETHTGFSIAEGIGDATGTHQAVEFKAAEFATFNPKQLPGTTYDWVSFNYVLPALPSDVIDVEITFTDKNGKTINVPKFTNVPVERNHRTNIVGDLLTDPAKFNVIIDPIFDDEDHNIDNIVSVNASTNEEIEEALNANAEYIVINMAADLTVDVTAWATMAFGGDKTKSVTINGDGHTLTFNLKDSDWSHVVMANAEGKLILNDVNIASSGYNTGHWKRTIVHFASEMELNNVTAAQGLGFKKDAKLNNVTINVANDNYAFWVWAEGQTIDIDGLTIASEGRAIKIGDEDATGTAVTLNIANSTFASKKKAAVLVSSKGGATINWGANNNIANVEEDQDFAVWVDEDWAQYDAKVIVNGCNKKIEGTIVETISTMDELKSVLVAAGQAGAGDTTIILKDDIDMTGQSWTPIAVDGYHGADIVTLNGNGKTITGLSAGLFKGGFAGGSGIVIKDLTIENAAIVANNTQGYGAFVGCADSMDEITLINCHLVNSTIITPNDGQDESRIGGLIGWTAGYNNQNDGPVDSYITVKNCSVTGCTLKGWGSIGGIVGHAGANAATFTVIEDCTVTNNQLISTDDGGWRVGVVIGTANNGQAEIKNIIESGNTLTQDAASDTKNPSGEKRNYYGRFVPSGTGSLVIDGVQQKTTSQVNFEALVSNGGSVALTENVEITAPMEINANVTIDLAGKTITGIVHKSVGAVLKNNGALTIKGGKIASTADNGASAIANYGTMIVEGATIVGAPRKGESWPAYPINNYGDMTLKNTSITGYQGAIAFNKAGTTTLENCTLTKEYVKTSSHVFYINHAEANVIVNGGTYTHKGFDGSLAYVNKGTLTVNAGTFNVENGGYGFAALAGGKIIINGGTINANPINWGGVIEDNR